jgi:hypothetical protein
VNWRFGLFESPWLSVAAHPHSRAKAGVFDFSHCRLFPLEYRLPMARFTSSAGLSASSCPGTESAVSAMIDYRPMKRVEAYAGVLWSQATGGMASGYLYHVNLAPTVGVRVRF